MIPAILALLAIVAGAVANIVLAAGTGNAKLAAWLATVAMIVLLCACIGRAVAARWDGVLINDSNRVSLSRLQMFAWTVLVLSAVITIASSNIALVGSTAALIITIPNELLAAMGIAAASLAATPALLTLKGSDPGTGRSMAAGNGAPQAASWLEIFCGDEKSDAHIPDLSKIQQFLITLVLVGIYGVAIGSMLLHPTAPPAAVPPAPPLPNGTFWTLPPLNANFVWLLGISHAGYLGYKAASKPAARTAPDTAAEQTQAVADPGPPAAPSS